MGRDRKEAYIQNNALGGSYSFIDNHSYLDDETLVRLGSLVGNDDFGLVEQFEHQFSSLIGEGSCISYATGRMGFYDLMRVLKITPGDEIIILGFTCAVMVNAITRLGAVPVFSDVNNSDYGSDPTSINNLLSSRTKIIVAQHSFGIPCDIVNIMRIANSRKIFVVEDCALSVGSAIEGKLLGNFGHAALFSTDHTKPLNSFLGGLIYTKNESIFNGLKEFQRGHSWPSHSKQKAMWRQLLFERTYCTSQQFKSFKSMSRLERLKSFFAFRENPFFDSDNGLSCGKGYDYPLRMPTFLAELGLKEISRWKNTAVQRKKALARFKKIFEANGRTHLLPAAYHNKSLDIVPLRLTWQSKNRDDLVLGLAPYFDIPSIWFFEPISGGSKKLVSRVYKFGSCPKAEALCKRIINIPCYRNWEKSEQMLAALEMVLFKKKSAILD